MNRITKSTLFAAAVAMAAATATAQTTAKFDGVNVTNDAKIGDQLGVGTDPLAGYQLTVDGTSPVLSRMASIGTTEYGYSEWAGDTNNLRIGVYGFTQSDFADYRLMGVIEETSNRQLYLNASNAAGSIIMGAGGRGTAANVGFKMLPGGDIVMGEYAISGSATYDVNVVSASNEASSFGVYSAGTGANANASIWANSGAGDLGMIAFDNNYSTYPNYTSNGVLTTSSYGGMGLFTHHATLGNMDFYTTGNTNADHVMRMDTAQRVSIGTKTANAKLHVYASADAPNLVRSENALSGTAAYSGFYAVADGGGFAMTARSSTFAAVAEWADTGVISADSTLDGGLSIYSTDRIRMQNAIGETALLAQGDKVKIGDSTLATSTLSVGGSFGTGYVAKTAAYTATASDHIINCTSDTFTVTLPTAVGISGRQYVIKNSGAGVITVDGDAAETIDGAATASLATQYDSLSIVSDGANWIAW